MVQGYTQQNSRGKGGWASYLSSGRTEAGKLFSGTFFYSNEAFRCSYSFEVMNDQWTACLPKKLSYQELKRLFRRIKKTTKDKLVDLLAHRWQLATVTALA